MARQAKRRKATTRKGGESPVDLPMDETNKAKGNNNNVSSAESTNNYQGWRIPVRTNGETESTSTSTSTIDVLDGTKPSISPERFYREYVSIRKPCLFRGNSAAHQELLGTDWKVWEKWFCSSKEHPMEVNRVLDTTYLMQTAGDTTVAVEERSSRTARFGRGNEIRMPFSKFLSPTQTQTEQQQQELWYLTTQDVTTDSNGRPQTLSKLMACLRDDFPLRPKLLGGLIPSNVNLWMGGGGGPTSQTSTSPTSTGSSSSSSGLHHDYHDNLYILLQGRKRFRLFAPSDAPYLYTRGELSTIHPNGRIQYVGDDKTNADGSTVHAEAALDADLRLEEARRRLCEAESNEDDDEMERAELEVEEAMEAVLDAERDEDDEDGDDDEQDTKGGLFGENDDFSDDDESVSFWDAANAAKTNGLQREDTAANNNSKHGCTLNANDDFENDDSEEDKVKKDGFEEDDESVSFWQASKAAAEQKHNASTKKRKLGFFINDDKSDTTDPETMVSGVKDGSPDDTYNGEENLEGKILDQTVTDPLNFSLLDLDAMEKERNEQTQARTLTTQYPEFRHATGATVHMEAGDMLYLPASWFHEVTSYSGTPCQDVVNTEEPRQHQRHVAFNYWCHPPDAMGPKADFDEPYTSHFWQKDWKLRTG